MKVRFVGREKYTSIALKDIRIRGANKQLIFDIWVLNIRTLRGEL